MDETNKDILRLLRDNGRMPFSEIGARLGISRVAVKKRVMRKASSAVIRRCCTGRVRRKCISISLRWMRTRRRFFTT